MAMACGSPEEWLQKSNASSKSHKDWNPPLDQVESTPASTSNKSKSGRGASAKRKHNSGGGDSPPNNYPPGLTSATKTPAASSATSSRIPGSGGKTPGANGSPKPPHSYVALIYLAMKSSGRAKVTLAEIYEYILERFPYYRSAGLGWKNSIRHNLTQQKCFVKVARLTEDGGGKGGFWAPHASYTGLLEERAAKGDSSFSAGGSGRPKSGSKSTAKKRRTSMPSRPPRETPKGPSVVTIKAEVMKPAVRITTSNYEGDENQQPLDAATAAAATMGSDSEQDSDEEDEESISDDLLQVAGQFPVADNRDGWLPMPRDGSGVEQLALQNWFSPVNTLGALGSSPFKSPTRSPYRGKSRGFYGQGHLLGLENSPMPKKLAQMPLSPSLTGFGLGVDAMIGSWLATVN